MKIALMFLIGTYLVLIWLLMGVVLPIVVPGMNFVLQVVLSVILSEKLAQHCVPTELISVDNKGKYWYNLFK